MIFICVLFVGQNRLTTHWKSVAVDGSGSGRYRYYIYFMSPLLLCGVHVHTYLTYIVLRVHVSTCPSASPPHHLVSALPSSLSRKLRLSFPPSLQSLFSATACQQASGEPAYQGAGTSPFHHDEPRGHPTIELEAVHLAYKPGAGWTAPKGLVGGCLICLQPLPTLPLSTFSSQLASVQPFHRYRSPFPFSPQVAL